MDGEVWYRRPVEYRQSVKTDTDRAYTTASYHQIDRQVWLCSGYLMEAREEEDVQVRPGDRQTVQEDLHV